MDLRGVWDGLQPLTSCSQGACDEVCGTLLPKAKHHAASHIKHIALSGVGTCTATGDDVPVDAWPWCAA